MENVGTADVPSVVQIVQELQSMRQVIDQHRVEIAQLRQGVPTGAVVVPGLTELVQVLSQQPRHGGGSEGQRIMVDMAKVISIYLTVQMLEDTPLGVLHNDVMNTFLSRSPRQFLFTCSEYIRKARFPKHAKHRYFYWGQDIASERNQYDVSDRRIHHRNKWRLGIRQRTHIWPSALAKR